MENKRIVIFHRCYIYSITQLHVSIPTPLGYPSVDNDIPIGAVNAINPDYDVPHMSTAAMTYSSTLFQL